MATGLRRRLLLMLMAPLLMLALANAWLDYRSGDNTSARQDQRLLALLPLLADSLIGPGNTPEAPPVMLLAPELQQFLSSPNAAFAVFDADGKLLRGEAWLDGFPPTSSEPEFHSEQSRGITWRIVRQRQQTVLGEVVVVLADGTDPRQQWLRSILLRVLLPNLLLLMAAAISVRWAVERALGPLLALREAVERRSPGDLSPIDEAASPEEVRPLVASLNRLFDLVNAQAEGQRRFIADAAHQLRTPLAALQAQVEAWVQAAGSSARPLAVDPEHLAKLQGATRRTTQLANQLLALSRADARAMESQPMEPVDLKAVCEDVLERFLDAAAAKQIDIGLDTREAAVQGHGWLLRELLVNLVDNAVKYTPSRGTITIRCGLRHARPYLEVEDDGPGIAAPLRPRALERFHRGNGTGVEGSGLGLSIADEIARLHNSRLELEAGEGGRGLRVTLLFAG
ncbi:MULTISPECIES: ATP-binding protein [Ramlibacter]|uniref:histidine kinase n=1 Tax=Ramlibacter aquaticus TaxID=2780094 RepID=A0ABR9SI26_9BURK|nr:MULTISPECIES: ATP-binding protein [Ramlibacter]MBE7941998.1 sensor histidine kinase N-terminal domain-containing protein [Ramlibacter aquaticus]